MKWFLGARATCAAVVMGAGLMTASMSEAHAQGEAPPAAGAGESASNIDEARAHYERAIELYNEESYDAALVEIHRAYDIAPSYKMLYNLGLIQRARKDFASALTAFEKYLAQGKASIAAPRRAEVEKLVATLKTRVASLEIVCPLQGASVAIDDVSVGTTPLKAPVIVNPGRRKVVATKPGYSAATSWIEVAGSDAERIELSPASLAVAGPATTNASEGSKTPMIVAWGVTGALAVATAVFGGIALKKSSDLDDERNTFTPGSTPDQTASRIDSAESSMHAFSITTDVLGGLTIVSAGVALYLTLTRSSSKAEQSAPPPAKAGSLGLGRFGLSGTF